VVQRVADGQRADAAEDLPRMRLGAWYGSEAAIEIAAAAIAKYGTRK
jgi:hypothetical protein